MAAGLLITDDAFGQRVSPAAKRRVLEALDLGIMAKGSVHDCYFLHDDWCGVLNGTDICLCKPTLRVTANDGTLWESENTGPWKKVTQ